MAWDNMADHWLESFDDLVSANRSADYVQRMQPHKFGDSNFVVELTSGNVVIEEPRFQNGGVKLLHFLQKPSGVSQADFAQHWQGEHVQTVLGALQPLGILRKFVQNPPLPLDPAVFKGTLFEAGGVGQYAGIEEFWFNGLEDLTRLRGDRDAWNAIRDSYARLTAPTGSFSMVTTERVVFDYATPGRQTPKPAVLTPGTLEALIDAQGYGGFNIPRPAGGKS